MTLIFHALVALCLIMLQTAFLPQFHPTRDYYNLMIPLIIFIGLGRPFREGGIATVAFGLFMDGLSGGPFGFFTTAFFWIFIGTKWMMIFLHAGSWLVLPFLLSGSVLAENLIYMVGWFLSGAVGQVTDIDVHRVLSQMAWAGLTGPFVVWGIEHACARWCRWTHRVLNGNGF